MRLVRMMLSRLRKMPPAYGGGMNAKAPRANRYCAGVPLTAAKKPLGGMSLNGHARQITSGGIILDISEKCQGYIQVLRACPWGVPLFLAGLFLISGCATTSKSADLEAQGLRNQITLLEAQIQAKDAEINTLKESLSQAQERIRAQARLDEAKPIKPDETVFEQPSVRQVQTALKNAGYYVGRIDGLMGARSREALRGFQADHNLRANGKINRKTWSLLRAYLNRVPLKPAVKSSG